MKDRVLKKNDIISIIFFVFVFMSGFFVLNDVLILGGGNSDDDSHIRWVTADEAGLPEATFSETRETLLGNSDLDPHYKSLINEYLNVLKAKYPTIDLRVFDHNLEDLEIINTEKENEHTRGKYIPEWNCIYLYFPMAPEKELTDEEKAMDDYIKYWDEYVDKIDDIEYEGE